MADSELTEVTALIGAFTGVSALVLSIRNTWKERTALAFSVKRMHDEAREDEEPDSSYNGIPIVDALEVTITNKGGTPVTIRNCECIFGTLGRDGVVRKYPSNWTVDSKIGLGECCRAFPRINKKSDVVSVVAIDSSGRRWEAPKSILHGV